MSERLRNEKCAKCSKPLGYTYEAIIEYGGSHWHASCLLDRLTGDNLYG